MKMRRLRLKEYARFWRALRRAFPDLWECSDEDACQILERVDRAIPKEVLERVDQEIARLNSVDSKRLNQLLAQR